MEFNLRGRTALVAGATYGIGEAPGLSSMDLAARASVDALAQAGLTPGDVDGLFVCTPDDMLSGLTFAEYLGINPKFTDNNRSGGSAFEIYAHTAAMALCTGQIDVALIAYGSNQRSAAGKLITSLRPNPYEWRYRLPRPVGS